MSSEKMILGVDPGRSKTGLALVTGTGELVKTQVALMTDFAEELQVFLADVAIDTIVLGNGTTSQAMTDTLKRLLPGLAINVVEESYSTEEARKLYWELHPPRKAIAFRATGTAGKSGWLGSGGAGEKVYRQMKAQLITTGLLMARIRIGLALG